MAGLTALVLALMVAVVALDIWFTAGIRGLQRATKELKKEVDEVIEAFLKDGDLNSRLRAVEKAVFHMWQENQRERD